MTRGQGDADGRAGTLSPRLVVSLSLLVLSLTAGSTHAAPRDLQAHGSDDRLWLARVEPLPGNPPGETTALFVRLRNDPLWQRLEPIGGRPVIGLASRGSQVAALLANGDWLLMTDSGPTSGRPLPDRAHMIALGSDAGSLWAVGLITPRVGAALGAPASRPAATRPTTTTSTGTPATGPAPDPAATNVERNSASAEPPVAGQAAATRPTPASRPAAAPSAGGRLALYRLGALGWEEQGPLPGEIAAAEGVSVSLAIAGGRPVLAHKAGDRVVRVFRREDDGGWRLIDTAETPADLRDFKALAGDSGPVLWLRAVSGPDRLWIWRGPKPGDAVLKELPARGADGQADQAMAAANGALRLLWVEDEQIYEQRLNATTGAEDGKSEPSRLPAVSIMPAFQQWAQIVLMGAVIFAMAASMRRRREMLEVELDPAKLPLAPFPTRLLAGAIDTLPAGVVFWIAPEPQPGRPDSEVVITFLVACGVYLGLTTLVEVLAGRSIGKLATGLRVVGLDGKPAPVGARVVRNVLRVIDLAFFMPLLLILFSPLRQRAGDLAAGTLVVRSGTAAEGENAAAPGGDQSARKDDNSMTKPE